MGKKAVWTIGILAAALCLLPCGKVRAEDSVRVSGTADVYIKQAEAFCSTGAASEVTFSETEAQMQGELDRPGAWAYYTLEVENKGRLDARLSKAELTDQTPSYITVTSGAGAKQVGDVLKPGETRQIGILVQWDETDTAPSADASGSYGLTLVFEEPGQTASPDTADPGNGGIIPLILTAGALPAGMLYKKGREKA